ncbi:MAG: flagellar export chaperone FlgN [Spirochaetales bacterium]|nr:flagellar export chaperone FlgN [Spirochaetales bacterium]
MMKELDNTKQLIHILEKEIAHINEFTEVEKSIMDSVIENNWDTLEGAITQCNDISQIIERLDEQRETCVEILRVKSGEDSYAHFYRLTSNLETENKNRINDLYRDLKLAVLNLRNISWRIDAYTGTVTGIMKQTLKEIYPNRRGSLYSRSGMIKEADSNPMVLNRKL